MRQFLHELFEAFVDVRQVGRELPEDRTELVTQPQQTRSEKISERLRHVFEAASMRDVLRRFDGEVEIVRRLLKPLAEALGLLQPVERAVDLDRRDLAAGEGELLLLRELRRVENPAPRRISPTGHTNTNVGANIRHGRGLPKA